MREVCRPTIFSANNNACGPCPQVLLAVQTCDASRYPDPAYTALRQKIADFHGVETWRLVLAGSASDSSIASRAGWRAKAGVRSAFPCIPMATTPMRPTLGGWRRRRTRTPPTWFGAAEALQSLGWRAWRVATRGPCLANVIDITALPTPARNGGAGLRLCATAPAGRAWFER